jgi:uncharacterized protein
MTPIHAYRKNRITARAIVFAVALLFSVGRVYAVTYPTPKGFVTDTAPLMTAEERQSLEAVLMQIKTDTGNEIAIVTIPSLEGEPIEDYAVKLFEQWGIGQKEKDNGLLMLIAKEDRAVRIEVGYGLEPIINDAKAGRIIREVIAPSFQQEKYGEGIANAVDAIAGELRGESVLPAETPMAKGIPRVVGQLFPLLFFALIYGVSYLGRSKRWWPGGAIGAVGGVILGIIFGTLAWALGSAVLLGLLGLGLDYVVSKNFASRKARGLPTDWRHSGGGFWFGGMGGSGGLGGGGFGGFGGGISGGGGASGRW